MKEAPILHASVGKLVYLQLGMMAEHKVPLLCLNDFGVNMLLLRMVLES